MSGDIVGRGTREAGALMRQWFAEQDRAAGQGTPAAYVFVMGSLAEIFRAFAMPLVFPEIHALQTAVRHVAHEYLTAAEDYGFSPDVCGYVKADVAVQLAGGRHPMGRIPKPALALATNACNTYVKWGEFWERYYHIPLLTMDIPGSRRGEAAPPGGAARDLAYVRAQLDELIAACERVTGRALDLKRLESALYHSNRMALAWKRVLELNTARPAPFNAVVDGTMYLGVLNAWRGTPEGAAFLEDLVEELEHKVAAGSGALDDERYRLLFVGVPCYPLFRRFHEMFADRGGAFVGSSYLWFAAGGADLGFQYDLARPLDSLAAGVLRGVRHAGDAMLFPDAHLVREVSRFGADGIVYHPVKSCRTVSTGLAGSRRTLVQATGVACLFIESDMMDRRVVAEAQLKNRIDAFFEGLAGGRLRAMARSVPLPVLAGGAA